MDSSNSIPDLSGSRVLVPGGTGSVGEGVVRGFLAAGADVVVPTRTSERADEFGAIIRREGHTDIAETLHLVVHDYTTFDGAIDLAAQMVASLGGIDHVVAPIGGWWSGKRLWEIDESDWQSAFVELATTHMAVARAVVPKLTPGGTYTVVVGASAEWPVPTSGLVSMEQAAVLMMQQVLTAELDGSCRTFALVLGPVSTRAVAGEPDWITSDQVGSIAVSLAADTARPSQVVRLTTRAEIVAELKEVRA